MATESIVVKELTIGERAAALRILDAFHGGLNLMRVLLEDIKLLAISQKEWEEAKLVKTPNPGGGEQWNWDEELVKKDVTLQPETVAFLKSEITRKSEANELTLADVALSTLEKKLA